MSAPALPAYGYAHRARVVRLGEAEETYLVEVPAIAPGILSGPFPSAVRDLQVGDQVLVLQVGPTGGDLVIVCRVPERAPDFTLPIEISDVTGLAAALDNRATDAELTSLAGVVSGQGTAITAIQGVNTTQNTRLDGIDALNTTQNGRLTAVEGVNTTQDGRLTTDEANIAANTANIVSNSSSITALNTYAWFSQDHEADCFGDLISSMPRVLIANGRTLTSNGLLGFRTRARKAFSAASLRVIVTAVGAGAGTVTGGLYKGAAQHGTYSLVGQGTNALASLGEAAFTLGSPAIAAGDWLLLCVRAAGYSTFPKIGTTQVQVVNSAHQPSASRAAFPTRTTSGALPATIDTSDGSWGIADPTPWWLAIA